jgi:hypothetical protein
MKKNAIFSVISIFACLLIFNSSCENASIRESSEDSTSFEPNTDTCLDTDYYAETVHIEEEKGEANLYGRWIRSEEYKILQNYVGKDISEVPEEYREKIAKLRSFGFGLKKGKKEKLKEVIEDRDVAKELNEETRELEHQVSEELNKRKGKLKI